MNLNTNIAGVEFYVLKWSLRPRVRPFLVSVMFGKFTCWVKILQERREYSVINY